MPLTLSAKTLQPVYSLSISISAHMQVFTCLCKPCWPYPIILIPGEREFVFLGAVVRKLLTQDGQSHLKFRRWQCFSGDEFPPRKVLSKTRHHPTWLDNEEAEPMTHLASGCRRQKPARPYSSLRSPTLYLREPSASFHKLLSVAQIGMLSGMVRNQSLCGKSIKGSKLTDT